MADQKVKLVDDVKPAPTAEIKENDWNPNEMSEEILESLKHGLLTEGFITPILVQTKTNQIIDGAHRFRAAKELGLEQVLVQYLDVDDHAAKKLTLALNNRRGTNEGQKLSDLLADLTTEQPDLSALELGFSSAYFDQLVDTSDDWAEDLKDEQPPEDTVQSESDLEVDDGKEKFTRINFVLSEVKKATVLDTLEDLRMEKGLPDLSEALFILCGGETDTGVFDDDD